MSLSKPSGPASTTILKPLSTHKLTLIQCRPGCAIGPILRSERGSTVDAVVPGVQPTI